MTKLKISESENFKFFEEDATSNSKTSFLSRFVMAFHNRIFRENIGISIGISLSNLFAIFLLKLFFPETFSFSIIGMLASTLLLSAVGIYSVIKISEKAEQARVEYINTVLEEIKSLYNKDAFNQQIESAKTFLHESIKDNSSLISKCHKLKEIKFDKTSIYKSLNSIDEMSKILQENLDKLNLFKNAIEAVIYSETYHQDFFDSNQNDMLLIRNNFLNILNGEFRNNALFTESMRNLIASSDGLNILINRYTIEFNQKENESKES